MTCPQLPNLVILGAQKAATSYVQHCLGAHPQVHLVRREIPLFAEPDFHPSQLAGLARLAPRSGEGIRWFGIKRPDYLASPEAPRRIADHLPGVRLVVVLRDPVRRALSAYYHYMRYSYLPVRPLAEGMARILAGGGERGSFAERAILDYGRYATHLSRWLEHFPRSSLLVLLQERLRSDPVESLAELHGFLGLEGAGTRPVAGRPNEGVYSLFRIRWLQAVQRLACRVESERNRWGFRAGLLGMGLYWAARRIDRWLLRPFCARSPQPLPAPLEAELRRFYAGEIERLEEMFRLDLSAWRRAEGES